jgi:hypothetical protein
VSAIDRPAPAHAENEAMAVGHVYVDATSVTGLQNSSGDAFSAISGADGYGVSGGSNSYYGVTGNSQSSYGVYGTSSSSVGVVGQSGASNQPATAGWNTNDSVGVEGYSGAGSGLPAPHTKTGVFGYADQDGTSRGVWGESPAGVGVHGESGTNVGVYGHSGPGVGVMGQTKSGYAGYFDGRVFTTKFYELQEITAPTAPDTHRGRMFLRNNGLGKAQLCVRFASGLVQVIITEP